MEILSTSVGELWRQVLPPGSILLAGDSGLSREVTWVSTLRVRPPAFPNLGLGEMALLASDWLELIDPPLVLSQVLEGLAQRGAAAVAVLGQVPEDSIQRAEVLGMPLLQLPQGTNIYELEAAVARFINRQRTVQYQQGAEIHRRLLEASIQGKGVLGLLQILAQATGKAAALLDQRYQPRHLAAPPGVKVTLEALASALTAARFRLTQSSPRAAGGPEPPVLDIPISLAGYEAIGCALSLRGQVAANLLLVGAAGKMGTLERLALAQAASVFAAEMAKERAVVEAESRLKGDFLEELLEGSLADEAEMASRAQHLGYNIAGPNVVVVIGVEDNQDSKPGVSKNASAAIFHRLSEIMPPGTAALARNGEAVVIMPQDGLQEDLEPSARAETLRQQVAETLTDFVLSAGVGRCYPGLRGLQRSYQEARRALTLGRDIAPGGRTHFFGSQGVYPILMPLCGTQEVGAFLDETLGRLLGYDRHNNTALTHTLEAYFSCLGNLGQTAETLHLHRNSLTYRLRRIQEVAGISLDDAEHCFRLQLALKLRRLLAP